MEESSLSLVANTNEPLSLQTVGACGKELSIPGHCVGCPWAHGFVGR
jgi:hypothetical protein